MQFRCANNIILGVRLRNFWNLVCVQVVTGYVKITLRGQFKMSLSWRKLEASNWEQMLTANAMYAQLMLELLTHISLTADLSVYHRLCTNCQTHVLSWIWLGALRTCLQRWECYKQLSLLCPCSAPVLLWVVQESLYSVVLDFPSVLWEMVGFGDFQRHIC